MVRKRNAMLTYSFDNKGKDSLYEFLYKSIRDDIICGKLSPEEKLPSKRAFAEHLGISTITVETAYNQLVAEGYIHSKPKSGFYVSSIVSTKFHSPADKNMYPVEIMQKEPLSYAHDFSGNSNKDSFPFVTWTKLMRQTMSDKRELLTLNSPSVGIRELRCAISDYLFQFRGMSADPECIIIGAGTAISLSASGSRNLPKSVMRLCFLAILPSSMSVMAVPRKRVATMMRWGIEGIKPTSIKKRNTGMRHMRKTVSLLGKFMIFASSLYSESSPVSSPSMVSVNRTVTKVPG